jgi:hypothetical protein
MPGGDELGYAYLEGIDDIACLRVHVTHLGSIVAKSVIHGEKVEISRAQVKEIIAACNRSIGLLDHYMRRTAGVCLDFSLPISTGLVCHLVDKPNSMQINFMADKLKLVCRSILCGCVDTVTAYYNGNRQPLVLAAGDLYTLVMPRRP